MTTINFPTSPTLNQEYTFQGKSWFWNGTGWQLKTAHRLSDTYMLDRTNHTGEQAISTITNLQSTLDDKVDASALIPKLNATGGTVSGLKFTVSTLGNITGATAIDLATAQEFTATVTGDVTFSFTNAPALDESQVVCLRLTNAGSHAIDWPANTQFDASATLSLTAGGVDLLGVKYDGGTYMVFVIGLNVGVPV